MLSNNLIEKTKLSFLTTITNKSGNIISIINIESSNQGDIMSSKDLDNIPNSSFLFLIFSIFVFFFTFFFNNVCIIN